MWIDARTSLILGRDGRPAGIMGVSHNISERKQAEAEVFRSEQRLRAIIQNSPDCIKVVAPDGALLQMNPAGLVMLEAAGPEEVIGKSIYSVVAPDCRERYRAFHEAVCQGRRETLIFDVVGLKGAHKTMQTTAVPLLAEGKTLSLGITRDISEARSLEEQLRQAQKMEAVGQLAGGVAHDFNNLLCIINGYSDLLIQRLPPGDPSLNFLSEIRSAGERSASLTRQLLAFSRKQVVAPKILDVNAVVADTEKMLRRLIGEDVRLATSLAGGLGSVRADAGQLEQVLLNLAVNARDAMPQGGRLTIETRNVELDGDAAEVHADIVPGPYVLLAVSDTGCGMTAEVKARVFEPFFTTKEPGKGTGLGLAVVHDVVKQAGGHVEVYSEVGVGTTFKVYLPRLDQSVRPAKSLSEIKVPPGGTETVLLVEDDDGVRLLTRQMLKGLGYVVLEAGGGAEGLCIGGKHPGPIHLIITDVVMPGMSGRQVAEGVAALHPEARVLFVSGYTNDAVVRHGVLQEKVHFLPKPFSPLALAVKVRDVLGSSR